MLIYNLYSFFFYYETTPQFNISQYFWKLWNIWLNTAFTILTKKFFDIVQHSKNMLCIENKEERYGKWSEINTSVIDGIELL